MAEGDRQQAAEARGRLASAYTRKESSSQHPEAQHQLRITWHLIALSPGPASAARVCCSVT